MKIAKKMSGPSIRMISIAKELSKKFTTILYASRIEESEYSKYDFLSKGNVIKDIMKADYIYSQPSRLRYLFFSRFLKKKIIIDLYDPTDIENLEMYKDKVGLKSRLKQFYTTYRLKYSIKIADYFVCSNEVQRDYWIGYLQGLNKISSDNYNNDNNINNVIGYLPYGIEAAPEKKEKNILKKKFNFDNKDKVFVWAGGIWNWFDSENLVKAMKIVKNKDKNIKLLFMGIPKQAKLNDPKYNKVKSTIKISNDLGLTGKNVIFNDEWIDYDIRHEYLLECFAGISLHYKNLETKYSFRTRILDYLWCNLPFITSNGDYLSKLCENNKLGLNAEYENPEDIAEKILELASNEILYKEAKKNILKVSSDYRWDNVCLDLINYIENSNYTNKKENQLFTTLYLITIPFRVLYYSIKK